MIRSPIWARLKNTRDLISSAVDEKRFVSNPLMFPPLFKQAICTLWCYRKWRYSSSIKTSHKKISRWNVFVGSLIKIAISTVAASKSKKILQVWRLLSHALLFCHARLASHQFQSGHSTDHGSTSKDGIARGARVRGRSSNSSSSNCGILFRLLLFVVVVSRRKNIAAIFGNAFDKAFDQVGFGPIFLFVAK